MGIDLYYAITSAPCRNVILTAKAIGLDINLKLVNFAIAENRSPEFVKMNPQHNIPLLNDNGFCINESRAIMIYLVSTYGKNDSLYPNDLQKRAVVDQRLYFDIGTLSAAFGDYWAANMHLGIPLEERNFKKCLTAMEFLEIFLKDSDYVAGSNMTIADLAILTTVSTYEVMDFDFTSYPKVAKWLTKMKAEVPYYQEANGHGVAEFKKMVIRLKENNYVH